MDAADQVFVSDAGTSLKKADIAAIAKYIVENYAGSTIGGSAQSVQAAIGALNSSSNSSYKSSLATGSDLNQVISSGVYMLSGSNSYTNLPAGITYGILEVIKTHMDAGWVLQRLNVGPEMYSRFSTNRGASWGAWLKYLTANGS